MADRLVTGTRKRASDGKTLQLCNPDEPWSPRAVKDAIADIESGTHTYFSDYRGRKSRIIVARGRLGNYLRSSPDSEPGNNLGDLPDCIPKPGPGPVTATQRIRRNIATVSLGERLRLRDAIIALNTRHSPLDPAVSWWKKQDEIHQSTHIHGGPAFLPWHRELLNRFEALLQEVDPSVALHYWDWQTDPRASSNGRGGTVDLFTQDFMGSAQGAAGPPFDYLNITRDVAAGTPRNFEWLPDGATRKVWADIGPDERTIGDGDYPNMRLVMEEAHDLVHGYIGGTLRSIHSSFEDPFVFLVHSNVDRLWASWQLRARGDSRLALPGLHPDTVYGSERDLEFFVDRQGSRKDGIPRNLQPWAGGGNVPVRPWGGVSPPDKAEPVVRTSLDRTVVRPPLYDRYTFPLGASWNAMLQGSRLPDGDIITATIRLKAVDSSSVNFVLTAAPNITWWKGLRVPDGEGNSWLIETQDSNRSATISLSAGQVMNGQELIFHKAKFAGSHRIVYRLGDLGRLPPGSQATFTWSQDA